MKDLYFNVTNFRTKSSKNILESSLADIEVEPSDFSNTSSPVAVYCPVEEFPDQFALSMVESQVPSDVSDRSTTGCIRKQKDTQSDIYNDSFAFSVAESQMPSDVSEPSTSVSSRKRKATQSNIDNAIVEAVNCFKKVCDTQLSKANIAVGSFGRMVTATVSEMSASKQVKAIKEVTNLIMSIKEEPE